jgi:hypothetical protein
MEGHSKVCHAGRTGTAALKIPTCGSYRRVRFARVLSVISGYGILARLGDLEGGVSDARG